MASYWLRRFYRILLYAYPRDFRRRFGREMEQVFGDRCRAIEQTSGLRGLLLFGAQIGSDWFLTTIREGFTPMHVPTPVPDAIGGPVFYTCERSTPGRGALINGAVLSLAVFALVLSVIGHVEVLPTPRLPGSGPPGYAQPIPIPSPSPSDAAATAPGALDTHHDGDAKPTAGKLATPDADHNGEISSTEIQRAPKALATPVKNRDTKEHPMKLPKGNLALTALAPLCLTAVCVAADRPDFSGQWNLNIVKSDFGGRKPTPIGSVLKVDHEDPVLKVIRTIATETGVLTTEVVYSTDGKETTNKLTAALFPDGRRELPPGREVKNTTRWDGTALVIETPVSLSGNNFTIKWTWSLSGDGKILTTVRTFATGERPQTEVYERK